MDERELFEAELARRGIGYTAGPAPGQYEVRAAGGPLLVGLDNLARQLAGDGRDTERVTWFTDQVLAAAGLASLSAGGIYWILEPRDQAGQAEHRAAVSPRLDQVLAHVSEDGALIRWITGQHLAAMDLTAGEAAAQALANLDQALRAAELSVRQVDGVPVLMFGTWLPSKASLLLAPALREVASPAVGWPLLAVLPDRDFVYLWNAAHRELIDRVGQVVVREHARAPYPLSTEVFRIEDTMRAIGSYA